MGQLRVSVYLTLLLIVLTSALSNWESYEDSGSYEVVGAHSSPEINEDTGASHAALIVRSRQRRSPHLQKWTGYGIGSYQGHYRPNYNQGWGNGYNNGPGHYPHGHGFYGGGGGPSHSSSNSHAQAHAVSAQFGGNNWGAGFSGAAASAGSGSGSHNTHYGHHRK